MSIRIFPHKNLLDLIWVTSFTCPLFLTLMHTALPSLLRALAELKNNRIKVVAISCIFFFILNLKAALDLVSLKYE